jgi:hypothetical protein
MNAPKKLVCGGSVDGGFGSVSTPTSIERPRDVVVQRPFRKAYLFPWKRTRAWAGPQNTLNLAPFTGRIPGVHVVACGTAFRAEPASPALVSQEPSTVAATRSVPIGARRLRTRLRVSPTGPDTVRA